MIEGPAFAMYGVEGTCTMKNKKVKIASAILILTLGLFLIAAQGVLKNPETQGGKFRFPASHMFGDLRSATVMVEKRYAAQLAHPFRRRIPASIGRPADLIENLRFGILEGKYALAMDGENIMDVSFVDTPESDGRHVSVGSRTDFFTKFGSLFGLSGNPERIAVDIKGTKIVETYKAPSKEGVDVIVKVELDNFDRLVAVHTQPVSDRKIF